MRGPPDKSSIELVMSEFGSSRLNAGGGRFGTMDRLNPTLNSFRRIYPAAKVKLYTDQPFETDDGVNVVHVDPPFSRSEQRYGWRAHDYYQAFGLLQSCSDYSIAMDSDMVIVSEGFRAIIKLAEIYGLAVPLNPRLLLKIDGGIGMDSTYSARGDETLGLGLTYNLTPLAFATRHEKARTMLERYCELQVQSPGRGAVHLVKASYELAYHPCVLPPQWCVCSPRDLDSKHLWSEAIVLHVGHSDVLPRWRKEKLKQRMRRFAERVKGL